MGFANARHGALFLSLDGSETVRGILVDRVAPRHPPQEPTFDDARRFAQQFQEPPSSPPAPVRVCLSRAA